MPGSDTIQHYSEQFSAAQIFAEELQLCLDQMLTRTQDASLGHNHA